MEQHELPDGWAWTMLGAVAAIGAEQISPWKYPERHFNYLALEHIEQGTGRIIGWHPTAGAHIRSNKFKFSQEHVLYGKLRPYLRKAIAPDFEGVSATDLLPLRPFPEALDRHFLVQWLLSPQILDYVTIRQTGVKMPRLRSGDLEGMPVPLPPLPEQRRIVAKMEALLAESRTAREALARIPPLLQRFRQAVLAAAFRGALVAQDPADEPASVLLERIRAARRQKWEEDLRARGKIPGLYTYPEPEPLDTSGLPELPEGWVWTTVEEMGVVGEEAVKTGPFGVQLPSKEFTTSGVPVLAIGNVQWGCLSLASQDFVTEAKAQHLAKYRLRAGDVLFTRSGTVGRSAVVPAEADGWLMSYHLLRVRVDARVCLPEYLYFIFRGEAGIQERIAERSRGATRAGFNTALLRSLPIPLAPLAEQRRIVARIEALFAQGAAIEAAVAAAGRRVEHLDQSILARAFRGELVPQDPNDEPASVLLERIRREKGLGEGDDAT